MWNPSSIESEIIAEPNRRSVVRVLPPEHLLIGAEADSPSTARGAMAAIKRQRAHSGYPKVLLDDYDDALAYVFKQPSVQGHARFNRAQPACGTLYCAFDVHTALAERAFHHLRFLREQGGDLSVNVPVTQIGFDLAPVPILDVRESPFDAYPCFTDPSTRYTDCQNFADVVRKTEAIGIVYTSVRDIDGGANIAVLSELGLHDKWRDGRRISDWHVSVRGASGPVVMQRTSGAVHHFQFDENGRAI